MELRLVIGQLEEFAKRVSQELQEPDWETRREIVRALVKKVEIDEQEVRIVYRVSPSPFEGGPQQGSLQHCWGRDNAALRRPLFGCPFLKVIQDALFEEHLDQAQHAPVRHLLSHEGHQADMRDRVERDVNRMPCSTTRSLRIRMRSR